ncbi:hypothetical protein DSM25558_2899 [Agrobacterium sp. DSM 25558]|uniref:PIN domain-containing protein n=1 Tax=Agrobacterium sp. DSM 25558 TaxID=1907665 RepID=UPI00097241B7|nr:PIN domain-containing protein [Agrobacterium sp. DSM 25558]SCX21313.1 hypothetical protein DSM25558_2899 [Agrobacterium sp. DSM 25558]
MDDVQLASKNLPTLCIDTCSILDVFRDPTRDAVRASDGKAYLSLIQASVDGRLSCLIAQQVQIEFALHDQRIQDEAAKAIERLRKQFVKLSEITAVFGSPNEIDFSHLDDHVDRARANLERWFATFHSLLPDAQTEARAFGRVRGNRAPAQRGKDTWQDCMILETYLEAGRLLRAGGNTAPFIFLSSNTLEYFTQARILKHEIAEDFGPSLIQYAPTAGAALHALGL